MIWGVSQPQPEWLELKDPKVRGKDEKGRWLFDVRLYPNNGFYGVKFRPGMVRGKEGGGVEVHKIEIAYQDRIIHKKRMLAQIWTTNIKWR